jgi:uncharacterized protein
MGNKIALITGATSGIGAAFANTLASRGYDLIITGRREDKIRQFAAELSAKYQVKVDVMLLELMKDEDVTLLLQKVAALKELDILINNAGFIVIKKFIDTEAAEFSALMKVHDHVAVRLMLAALKNMLVNDRGAIINVTSIGAFILGGSSAYSAAKAYLHAITELLAKELRDVKSKVKVQALCPGITRSDLTERLGFDLNAIAAKRGKLFTVMSAESIVAVSLRALGKNKVACVPGWNYKLLISLALLRRIWSFWC